MSGGKGKAVVIYECGGPEVLKLVNDHPTPPRKASQVLLKVVSTSVNPVDTYVRKGFMQAPLPKVLGGDVAGVVVEADQTSKFKAGDKVFALTPTFVEGNEGCYAEYLVADDDWVAAVPEKLPLEEAGGLPLVALTAYQALKDADPQAGQRILITASSGGVGHMAVQLAKAWGLYVVGTTGPNNIDWVKQLGADEVVNYREQDLVQLYSDKPFDIVLDLIGGDLQRDVSKLLAKGGYLAHVLNRGTDQGELAKAKETTDYRVGTTLVKPNGQQLQEIAKLVDEGKVKLYVQQSFPLDQIAEAHKLVETWHTRGKVVITV